MKRQFIHSLLACNTSKEVTELINENKELLKQHPELYNNVFRTRLRINRVNKEKMQNWGELVN